MPLRTAQKTIAAIADIVSVTTSGRTTLATKTVLVVENHDEVRDLIARMVTLQGWQPVKAASVAEGLECLRRGHIDAIIADWQLNDGDSAALLQEARGGPPHAAIPAVVVSSYASPQMRREAQSAGALDLLEKPFRFQHLVQILESVAAGSPGPVTV
ncbi:MAG: response regulator [Candidatus Zixiibacteriota bacterium]